MDGPETHATAIDTLLRGAPLHATPRGVNLAIAVLLALLAPLVALLARPWLGLVIALAAGLAYVVAVQLLFGAGLILPFVVPLAGLAIGFVGTVLAHWLSATFERERTRDAFARFVPDSVVEQVLSRATEEGDPRLGGERMDATVMFSDLRGCTTFAEARDPRGSRDLTKGTRCQLFLGESTRDQLATAPQELEFVSELDVRGREHGIRVRGLREPQGAELPG
jgi:adenylate cyclase